MFLILHPPTLALDIQSHRQRLSSVIQHVFSSPPGPSFNSCRGNYLPLSKLIMVSNISSNQTILDDPSMASFVLLKSHFKQVPPALHSSLGQWTVVIHYSSPILLFFFFLAAFLLRGIWLAPSAKDEAASKSSTGQLYGPGGKPLPSGKLRASNESRIKRQTFQRGRSASSDVLHSWQPCRSSRALSPL